ncbi:Rv1733c family protein [Streptomyces lomondensis]|uniref:Proline rich protein membrane protein n=1 Tax=Streptomyces lomondensis TaxID=68229 RepID=A0ABQ2XR98_9ACTN|nr:hypothetical protein [Streptomyces lomondensis]MCF0080818.1 hypothetical protein [Streptomyces lomondensis]GGX29099.1 hypothetical protein GCM10010383_69620 [Streptomyces lomondensis]
MDRGIPPAQPPPEELPRRMLWLLRRHPLRRRTDLLQAWIGLGLLLAVPAVTPAAVILAGDAAHRHYTRTARHQALTRYETSAILLHDAPRHPEPGSPEAKKTLYPVKVRFTDPAGRIHTAETDVQPRLAAGSTVRVWAGADGSITDPPLTAEQVRNRSIASAVLAALAVPVTAVIGYGAARHVLQRRNLAGWDADWARTAPRWTISP